MPGKNAFGGDCVKKSYGNIGRFKPSSFYDRNEGKKPVLLVVLPVLMVLVILAALYLAYRDSAPASSAAASAAIFFR